VNFPQPARTVDATRQRITGHQRTRDVPRPDGEEEPVHTDPAELGVPRPDGTLRVLRWGRGPRQALALHGITAVAEALPTEWSLFAVDLRGRGHSAHLPGPYGFGRHIEDILATVAHLELEEPVLAGHSLGAYLALLTAGQEPGAFGGLLLVDGGLPLPVPSDADLDALLDAGLGPALARLRETYPSVEAYFDFWRAHPAMKDAWNGYLEDYLRYDLTGEDGVLRSRVSEQAARADGRELLGSGERLGAALRGLTSPARLLTAPAGMFGQPPGMLPPELCQAWAAQVPLLAMETVPGANHYTILLDPGHAATVARRLTET
jgi:pimeloyl-ACP methyl ester carboxylesterase